MICKPYEVVVVPFPLVERRAGKRRPDLALSAESFSADSGHTVLAMITSALNPTWPRDVPIDASRAGLGSASKVRMKIFTLDNRLILRKTGSLSQAHQRSVGEILKRLF